jgi:hypothetical protein
MNALYENMHKSTERNSKKNAVNLKEFVFNRLTSPHLSLMVKNDVSSGYVLPVALHSSSTNKIVARLAIYTGDTVGNLNEMKVTLPGRSHHMWC